MGLIVDVLLFAASLFIFAIGCGALFLVLVYLRDRFQTTNSIHRNYPVLGHLRYILKELGVFLRSYFSLLTAKNCRLTGFSAISSMTWPTIAAGSFPSARIIIRKARVRLALPIVLPQAGRGCLACARGHFWA